MPSNLTGTIVNNQVILTWTDNSTNETGFKIERMTGTGSWSVNGSVATDIVTYTDAGVTAGTTYTYRVYSFNSAGNSLIDSNLFPITIPNAATLPVVTTTTVTAIAVTTAASGGSISSDGGAPVTARGVVWSTNATPTIALLTKTTDGTGTGTFTSAITLLTANTTYHIRALATNSSGTAYGNEVTFTTTVVPQVWTTKNLEVTTYRDGTPIPQVTDPTAWANLTTGAWCYYNNDIANGTVYGKLYNWYAVNDSRGLAPTGYHVPSDMGGWGDLFNFLESGPIGPIAGGAMKATTGWDSPNYGATNSSGFTGLPGGWRDGRYGTFVNVGKYGTWWSSSEFNTTLALYKYLYYDNRALNSSGNPKSLGLSVRCLRD